VYACLCLYMRVFTYVFKTPRNLLGLRMYLKCVCMFMFIYVYVMYLHVCQYIYVFLCVHVNTYIYLNGEEVLE
jgi:hypothetical protein